MQRAMPPPPDLKPMTPDSDTAAPQPHPPQQDTLFPHKLTPLIKARLAQPEIARQFIDPSPSADPSTGGAATSAALPAFKHDAVADTQYLVHRGIIRKYHNRILLIASSHCAVHCRYCFRQHFDYTSQTFDLADLPLLTDYLAQHPEIDEVILSGGDPLTLKNRQLALLLEALQASTTVRRIRIHSRLLSVLPERLNKGLIALLSQYRPMLLLVMHINHRSELLPEVKTALHTLRGLELRLLNQSVLLRGVNDSASSLRELSEALFALGVMPYYLNLLDEVKGAEHFYVPDTTAQQIYRDLAASTSGYLVPKLVRDAGEDNFKRIIGLG